MLRQGQEQGKMPSPLSGESGWGFPALSLVMLRQGQGQGKMPSPLSGESGWGFPALSLDAETGTGTGQDAQSTFRRKWLGLPSPQPCDAETGTGTGQDAQSTFRRKWLGLPSPQP